MFWDSQPGSEALVLVAAGIVSYFIVNPYFLQLGDWRVYMCEEAEALLHSSENMNKFLKTCLTLVILIVVAGIQFGVMDAVIGTMTTAEVRSTVVASYHFIMPEPDFPLRPATLSPLVFLWYPI